MWDFHKLWGDNIGYWVGQTSGLLFIWLGPMWLIFVEVQKAYHNYLLFYLWTRFTVLFIFCLQNYLMDPKDINQGQVSLRCACFIGECSE